VSQEVGGVDKVMWREERRIQTTWTSRHDDSWGHQEHTQSSQEAREITRSGTEEGRLTYQTCLYI